MNDRLVSIIKNHCQKIVKDISELKSLENGDKEFVSDLIRLLTPSEYSDYNELREIYASVSNMVPAMALKYKDILIDSESLLYEFDSARRGESLYLIKSRGQRVSADLTSSTMLSYPDYRDQYYRVRRNKAVVEFFESLKFSMDSNKRLIGQISA